MKNIDQNETNEFSIKEDLEIFSPATTIMISNPCPNCSKYIENVGYTSTKDDRYRIYDESGFVELEFCNKKCYDEFVKRCVEGDKYY